MTIDPDRRAALLAAKLAALVRGRWPEVGPDAVSGGFPSGATLVDAGAGRAWVLIEADAHRRLGAALAVATRAGVPELHLLVPADQPDEAAVLARRAALFSAAPSVWTITDLSLDPARAAPPAVDAAPSPQAELYRPVLVRAGLEVVVEGGELVGEHLGLEVARVVTDPDGSARVEPGVGRFDREVGAMMFKELAEADALDRAVAFVAGIRTAGAQRHPLNQLVPERWLRSIVVAHPELVGASELRPVGSAVPRANLREVGVATAIGTDLAGEPLVVTCSTGVDLELVPGAADDRLAHAPGARLVLVVPSKDALPITTDLAEHLVEPAEVVTVGDDWPGLHGGRDRPVA